MCVAVDIIFCIKNSYCHSWLATTAIVIVIRSLFLSFSLSIANDVSWFSQKYFFVRFPLHFFGQKFWNRIQRTVFVQICFSIFTAIFYFFDLATECWFLASSLPTIPGYLWGLFFWGEIKCSRSFRLCENWYRKRDQGIVKKGWGIIYVLINYLLWLLCVCLSVYVIVCCGKSGNCFSLFLSRRRRRQLNSRSR